MNTTINSTQSDVFSFQRLYWFARKEILENWKVSLLSLAGLLAINIGYYVIIYLSFKYSNIDLNKADIDSTFVFGLTVIIGLLIVANRSFHYFSTKSQTMSALTTPVSVLERIAWFLIFTFPVFISAAFIIWKGVTWVAIPVFKAAFPTLGTAVANTTNAPLFTFYGICLIISIILISALGGIMMGRNSFLKIVACLVLFFGTIPILNSQIIKFLLANKPHVTINDRDFSNPSVNISQDNTFTILESAYQDIAQYWLYCVPVLLLVTIYYAIKDKEI